MLIWVDDERDVPSPGWVLARTAELAIGLLNSHEGNIQTLSLDHDLGPPEAGTGYDVIKWVEEWVFTDPNYHPPKHIQCHSSNASGRININLAIESIEREMVRRTNSG